MSWSFRASSAALLVLILGLAPAAGGEPRVIELAIRGGVLSGSSRVIRVQQGEEVVLRWTTDAPVTLHLHGYDIETRVRPGVPADMTVRARAAGRFPITLHHARGGAEATLAYVEVHPR